jgi:hypothetical protein
VTNNRSDDDNIGCSEEKEHDDNNNDEHHHELEQLKVDLVLRIHAANQPRYGVRKILPDTYASLIAIRPERYHHVAAGTRGGSCNDDSGVHGDDGRSDKHCDNQPAVSYDIMRRVERGRSEMHFTNYFTSCTKVKC